MNEQELTPVHFENVDAILEGLRREDGELPRDALRAAQANRETVIPRLIQLLEEAVLPDKPYPQADDPAVFYALFLLTEFQVKEALGPLVKVLHLEEEFLGALFGDALTETLPVTLCVLGEDEPDVVESLIANTDVSLYVRWSAAIALVTMVKKGRQTREDVLERLNRQLKIATDSDPTDIEQAGLLIAEMHRLAPVEYMDDIRKAYEGRYVEEFPVSLKMVEEANALGAGALEANLPELQTSIEDTVAELEDWGMDDEGDEYLGDDFDDEFDEDFQNDFDDEAGPVYTSILGAGAGTLDEMPEPYVPSHVTIVNREERVGRNDPCPCGSGKKFKKCCGAASKR